MLIAVNARFLIRDKLEGIGWYTYETIKRPQRHPEHRFCCCSTGEPDASFYSLTMWSRCRLVLRQGTPGCGNGGSSVPSAVLKKYKPDVLLSPDGFLPLKVDIPTVLVIHDLGFEHYPEHTPPMVNWFYRRNTPKYAKAASRIVTVSEFSSRISLKRYPHRSGESRYSVQWCE